MLGIGTVYTGTTEIDLKSHASIRGMGWKAPWVAVPTNVICGLFLPVSYLGFTLLQRNRAFLRDDVPRGGLATAWIGGMAVATIVLTVFLATVVVQQGPGFVERVLGGGS